MYLFCNGASAGWSGSADAGGWILESVTDLFLLVSKKNSIKMGYGSK
jgi:hypothetical protein